MKKRNFLKAIFIGTAGLALLSCQKKSDTANEMPETLTTDLAPGLPAKKGSINGYFYISNEVSSSINPAYYNVSIYAIFNDPAKNLISTYDHESNIPLFNPSVLSLGNVTVGAVSFGNTQAQTFNFGSNISYRGVNSIYSLAELGGYIWRSEGNKSFKPMNETMSRGFPTIVNTGATYSLSASKGYTLELNGFMSNYDSAMVSINFGSFKINKRVDKTESKIIFTPTDLSMISSAFSLNVIFMAFNYSYRTVADKVYVFEMASKMRAGIYVTP